MALFRRQVIDQTRQRLHGEVVCTPRPSHSVICALLLVWLLAAGLFLTQASYARRENVIGWLEPHEGTVRVYATREGKLARLLVREGELVHEGQALAVINGDRVLSDGRHLEAVLLEEYREQKTTLQRRLARRALTVEEQRDDVRQQITAGRSELDWVRRQLATLEERLALKQQRQQRERRLVEQGHIARVDNERQREAVLALQAEQQALHRGADQQRARLRSLESRLQLLQQEDADQRDALAQELSQVAQQIASLRGERAYTLKASRSGVVTSIQASEGQWVQRDRPLMVLVPEQSTLTAQLLLPVRASGFIQPGQPLAFRFDAFPYQKFGSHPGTIDSVAETIMLPGELPHAPVTVREPVYQVSASIGPGHLKAYGAPVTFKSGMTLAADITLEDRSILEWLLEPLYSLRGRVL